MHKVASHMIDQEAFLKGYKLSVQIKSEVIECFSTDLIEKHPECKDLLKNIQTEAEVDKFFVLLKMLVENVQNDDVLGALIRDFDDKCCANGLSEENYDEVIMLLLGCLKRVIGRKWTKAINTSWATFFSLASEIMYADRHDSDVAEKHNRKDKAVTYDGPILELESIQDISKSLALKNDLMSLVNDNDEINIDASSVERIDGSSLQLLCGFFKYAETNNLIVHWIDPSDAFIRSSKIIGVDEVLNLN